MVRGDGIKGNFQSSLGPNQSESMTQVNCVEGITKENIEQLSRNTPMACGLRQRLNQIESFSIECDSKFDRFDTELLQVEPPEERARSLDRTRLPTTSHSGRADSHSGHSTLHDTQEHRLSHCHPRSRHGLTKNLSTQHHRPIAMPGIDDFSASGWRAWHND